MFATEVYLFLRQTWIPGQSDRDVPERRAVGRDLAEDEEHQATIFGAVRPILRGIGDIATPPVEQIVPNLGLLPGDLGLSRFEDKLSDAWPRCHNSDEAAFRVMTAFHRLMYEMADGWAELVLIDVGRTWAPSTARH